MKRLGILPAGLVLLAFFIVPLLALVPEAFSDGGAAWGRVLSDRLFLDALWNTLFLGLAAGGVSTVVGVMVAMELARQPEPRRQWMISILGLPLAFSGLVIAYGFILAFGRAGFVTQLLALLGAEPSRVGQWIYTVGGLGFAYAYYLIPRVALNLYPVFVNLDRRPFNAARTLGASPWRAWWDTVAPEIAPSVFSAGCLVSALAMGTYGTALALAGTQLNILPLTLYARISDGSVDFAGAAVLSLILMTVCVMVLGAGDVIANRRERQVGEH